MGHKKQYVRAGFIWIAGLLRSGEPGFQLNGRTYPYFSHRYNFTWLNERRVEIPVINEIVASHPNVRLLEVGNVLSHYNPSMRHPVVDKYEQSRRDGFFSEDAETFSTGAPYDLIISISTLEHVGWDESPRDEEKVFRTVRHLRSLLTPGGELVFTAPVGYSRPLDRLMDEADGFIERMCLQRTNARNEWKETDWTSIRNSKFHAPYPFANGLVIARLSALQSG